MSSSIVEDFKTESQSVQVSPQRHRKFYSAKQIVLRVQNTLYRVDQSLLNEFQVFCDMFTEAQKHNPNIGEGETDDNPIQLEGVTVFQMDALLTLYYMPWFRGPPEMDAEQWSAVLHLCNMWIHPELCAITIDKLEKLELSSIDRIVLARRHGIRQWLKPAFTTLCTRTEHLTAQEARELGIDIFIRVVKIREEYKVAAVRQQAPMFGYTTQRSPLDRALDQMLDSEVMSD